MNEKIIVWKKNILATVKNIRRKLWVTKSDLIELINSIDKFFDKEVKRTDSNNIEFLKKIRNNECEIYNESNKIKGIKSSQTKQKKSIDQLKKIIHVLDKNTDNIIHRIEIKLNNIIEKIETNEKNINEVNKMNGNHMKKIHELNHRILQNEELITLKNAYDRAKNIQDSMIELEQYEEKIIKLGKEFRNEGSNVMCRINELTFQHKQAIEAQGKGIVASINGILRSKGLEIG